MNIQLTLTPTRVIALTLSAPAQGSIEFTPATAGLTLQLSQFFKGEQGPPGPPGPAGEAPTTWGHYAVHWTTAPAQVGTTAAGAVYSYTLSGTTRYRLVPSPYAAAQDAFYSAWDGAALSGLIVSRGI